MNLRWNLFVWWVVVTWLLRNIPSLLPSTLLISVLSIMTLSIITLVLTWNVHLTVWCLICVISLIVIIFYTLSMVINLPTLTILHSILGISRRSLNWTPMASIFLIKVSLEWTNTWKLFIRWLVFLVGLAGLGFRVGFGCNRGLVSGCLSSGVIIIRLGCLTNWWITSPSSSLIILISWFSHFLGLSSNVIMIIVFFIPYHVVLPHGNISWVWNLVVTLNGSHVGLVLCGFINFCVWRLVLHIWLVSWVCWSNSCRWSSWWFQRWGVSVKQLLILGNGFNLFGTFSDLCWTLLRWLDLYWIRNIHTVEIGTTHVIWTSKLIVFCHSIWAILACHLIGWI